MSEAHIEATGATLQLGGALDYLSAPRLRVQGKHLIDSEKSTVIKLDCSKVTHSSSVGLSLLLTFMRDAKKCGKTLVVCHLPEEMRQIAQMSGIVRLLEGSPA